MRDARFTAWSAGECSRMMYIYCWQKSMKKKDYGLCASAALAPELARKVAGARLLRPDLVKAAKLD